MMTQVMMMENTIDAQLEFHQDLDVDTWSASDGQAYASTAGQNGWINVAPVYKVKVRYLTARTLASQDSKSPTAYCDSPPSWLG
jgi:hypothetical protein